MYSSRKGREKVRKREKEKEGEEIESGGLEVIKRLDRPLGFYSVEWLEAATMGWSSTLVARSSLTAIFWKRATSMGWARDG